jgi:hypothetical protein
VARLAAPAVRTGGLRLHLGGCALGHGARRRARGLAHGIPEELHALLKESAQRNRRSLNSEILIRLESTFTAPLVDARKQVRQMKAFTDRQTPVDHALVDRFKRYRRT